MKNSCFLRALLSALFCLGATVSNAQSSQKVSIPSVLLQPISYSEFIKEVDANSGALNAKKLAVETSVAWQGPMSMSNINPSFSYSRGAYYGQTPYSPYVSPASNTYSLSGTIEGWGKRSARKDFAASEVDKNSAELTSLTRSIQGDATFSYMDTLRYKLLWLSYQKAIRFLENISDKTLKSEYLDYQSNVANDLQYYALGMGTYIGRTSSDLLEPTGDMNSIKPHNFELKELVANALNQRADILAMNQSINSANANLELIKKNRNIDLSPSVWMSTTPSYVSSGTQYGATTAYGFSVSVPIPVNLAYDADVVQAANNKSSQELYLRDLKARVVTEVNQAFLQYQFAKRKFETAKAAYDSVNKQPTNKNAVVALRDREGEYIDAKVNHAKALFYLQRVSGNYDLPNI